MSLGLFSLAVLAAPAASTEVPAGPHAGLSCGICHVIDDNGRPTEPVTLGGREERLCAGCHAKAVEQDDGPNHPSGFVPARALPAEFPLDAEGRMTCSTCHDLHGGATVLLRAETWACTACHPR